MARYGGGLGMMAADMNGGAVMASFQTGGPMIRPIDIIPAKAKLFRSVGDEGRLTILEALGAGERRVTDLAEQTRQSQSAVSTHLAALHGAGLVVRRAAGREAWYTLAHPTVGALLDAAEAAVIAASGESYACVSPCCSPTGEPGA
jgi:ArsR family transcriptional regulator